MAAARLPATGLPAAQTDQPYCTAPGTATGHETGGKASYPTGYPACDSTSYPASHSTGYPACNSTNDPASDATIYTAFHAPRQQTGSRRPTPEYEAAGTQADAESGGKAFLSYGVRVKGQSKPTPIVVNFLLTIAADPGYIGTSDQ